MEKVYRKSVWKKKMNTSIPTLPPGKEYHIFVCYCKENQNEVLVIVENLEKEGFKCCYYERDFGVGQSIITNMHESITKSMFMLVVLSVDFHNSIFCTQEVIQALHEQITEGYSIIPIKIEPCAVPDILKHLIYIDAEEDKVQDMHQKVISTVIHNDNGSKRIAKKNGDTKSFNLSKKVAQRKCLSLSTYHLIISSKGREDLWDNHFQLSEDHLNKIETIVNNSFLVDNHHIFTAFTRLTTLLFFILFLVYTGIIIIMCWKLLGRSPLENEANRHVVLAFAAGLPSVLFVGWMTCLCFNGCVIYTGDVCEGRITSRVHIKAWRQLTKDLWKINKNAKMLKCVVLFENKQMTLDVVRYDFGPCKDMFVRRCERNDILQQMRCAGETLEDYTDRLFEEYISSFRIHNLNRATAGDQRRHNMSNGAKCLCLLVELHLENKLP